MGKRRGDNALCVVSGSAVSWEQAERDFQGCVLAACALMGAVTLLPLGCPSRHVQEMYSNAVRMVADPLAAGAAARALERRLGCLMLSSLCGTLPFAMLQARLYLLSTLEIIPFSRIFGEESDEG